MFDCEVLVPKNVQELTAFLTDPSAHIIAGGTDLIPRMQRAAANVPARLIDISRLSELRFIRVNSGWIETGGLATHAEMVSSPLYLQSAPALQQACASIGAPQTRVRGTLGGNLANASPAADTAAPLLALDARVVLQSVQGQRELALSDFFTAPGKTRLQPGEFIYCVRFPVPAGRWGSCYFKLGRRQGMSVAVASAAVYLQLGDDDRIQIARAAFGSAAPTPVRSPHVEASLTGNKPSSELFDQAAAAVQEDISPITDIRASAAYRRRSAQVLLKRALQEAYSQALRRTI